MKKLFPKFNLLNKLQESIMNVNSTCYEMDEKLFAEIMINKNLLSEIEITKLLASSNFRIHKLIH